MAMTMGGWYLGSAVMAFLVAYHRRWNVIYSSTLYVGLFAFTELAVMAVHADKVNLAARLAWPYLGMLALAAIAVLFVLLDFIRQRPQIQPEGAPVTRWVRVVMLGFIVFVTFLAVVAFSGHWSGQKGVIFPEPLTLFTLRSFGAFYFSLALSVVPLLWARGLAVVTVHVWGGLALIAFITLAALINWSAFNFAEHPFQSIYIGVYLAVLALAVFYLRRERTRRGS